MALSLTGNLQHFNNNCDRSWVSERSGDNELREMFNSRGKRSSWVTLISVTRVTVAYAKTIATFDGSFSVLSIIR